VEASGLGTALIVAVNSASAAQMNGANVNGAYEFLARVDLGYAWIQQQIAAYPTGAPFVPPPVDAGAADTGTGATDGGAPDAAVDPCSACASQNEVAGATCGAVTTTCVNDSSCITLAACLDNCAATDATCQNTCVAAASATAVTEYNAVAACLCGANVCASACSATCGPASPVDGGAPATDAAAE
jgi:hypothetical protein